MARPLIKMVVAALTVAGLTSCNRTTGPSGPPITERVELIAPQTLAPGATAQLRLIAHQSGGSTQDITATSRFHTQSTDVLAILPGAVASALKMGEAFVTGHDGRVTSSREIVVVPDGTFRIVGQVFEEGTEGGVPIGNVRVETDGGAPSDVTDLWGRYRLYGVPAHGRIRASKNGYVTKELTLATPNHHTENVALALAGPRLDIAGAYELTIEAAPDCRGQIPEGLLTRRYMTAVSQSGDRIQVSLSGASTAVIPGRADRSGVLLELASPTHCDFSEPDSRVIEMIDNTTALWIGGSALLSSAGHNFTGALNGYFAHGSSPRCDAQGHVRVCSSPSHRVTLTRRDPR